MERRIKQVLSMWLAVVMLLSNTGITALAEEIPAETTAETEAQTKEAVTETTEEKENNSLPITEEASEELFTEVQTEPATEPVRYALVLPFYEKCTFEYDLTKEDPEAPQKDKSKTLLFEPNERVELSILPVDGEQIKELHLYKKDQKTVETAYQWLSENKFTFVMPSYDLVLDVSFMTLETETATEAETQPPADTEQIETQPMETEMQETEISTEIGPGVTDPDDGQPENGQEETLPPEDETELKTPETEEDGLPAQGSLVMAESVTIPFDTWEFDPETDFRGMDYDLEKFDIEYISDGIIYTEPGVYDCIYRVSRKGEEKFWFVLRPVCVAEEGEALETETELATEDSTEIMADPETESEALSEAADMTEAETEKVTEAEIQTETEEAADAEMQIETQIYINGGVNCEITLDETSDFSVGGTVRFSVIPDEGYTYLGANVYEVTPQRDFSSLLADTSMGLIIEDPVKYQIEDETDGIIQISFTMPDRSVLIEASAMDPEEESGISLMSELGEDLGKVDFTTPYGGGTWYEYPDKFTKTSGLGTVVKTFTIYDKDGKVLKEGVYGFCLESSKDTGGPTSDVPFSELDSDSEVLLAKALFYLTYGPGWGYDFTGSDGTVRNFKDIYSGYGLTTKQTRYSMTHLVLSKIYYSYQSDPNWSWNAGCTSDRMHSYSNVLNDDGKAFVNDIISQLKKMDYPECDLTPTSINPKDIIQGDERFITPTIKYTSLKDNYLTIAVDNKTWLVNETTKQTVHNGTAKVKGGESFHLELDESLANQKVTYTATPALYGDAGMYKVSMGKGSQDMAFSYSMDGLKFSISINKMPEWQPKYGYIEVQKQDSETGNTTPQPGGSFSGAQYTVYSNVACTNAVVVLTTNAQGYAKSSALRVENETIYYVKETKAPTGYELDPTVHKVTMSASDTSQIYRVVSKEQLIKKPIEIQKADKETGATTPQDGRSFEGAQYTIYRNVACTDVAEVLTTNASGYAKSAEYPLGTYYVKETKAPFGYYLDETVYTVKIQDGDNKTVYTVRSQETPIPVYIEVQKMDQDTGTAAPQAGGTFEGAQYTIYRDSGCTDAAEVLTTNEKGYAKSSRLLPAIYYVKETKAPTGYYLDETVYTVDARDGNGKEIFTVTSPEKLIKKPIEIQKYDKETGQPKPNNSAVTLEGAQYTIYRDVDLTDPVEVMTTNENGYAKSSDLTVGTYFIKETKAPEGYLLDETVITVTVADDGKTYYSVTSSEQVIRGGLAIMKYLDDNTDSSHLQDLYDSGILEGITFTLTHEDGSIDPVVLTTDRYGYAATDEKALVYGTWHITESNTPEGYEGIKDETITIKDNGETLRYVISNNQPLLAIKLQKRDEETGNLIPIRGAKFQVLDESGTPITMPDNLNYKVLTDTFTTDDDGEIKLAKGLPMGTYTIREVEAPEGYLLAPDRLLEITEEMMDQTEIEFVINCYDAPQMGKIRIRKSDQETGEALGEGFAFDVTAAENITDAAGTIRKMEIDGVETELVAGTVVAHIETDEAGLAETQALYLGKYLVTETDAADYYAVDPAGREVTLSYDGEVEEVSYELAVEDVKTKLDLYKVDSESSEEMDIPLSGIKFRIFTAEDLENAGIDITGKLDEEQLRELGEEYVTDETGRILVDNLHHDMTYFLFESETLPGYNLEKGLYHFYVDEKGLIDGQPVYTLKISNTANLVDISKKDITGEEELPGATLTVKDSEGNIIDTWVSTGEPHRIKGLAAGEYVLIEEQAPDGYAIAEEIRFTLADSLEVQQVTMYDEKLQVQVSKKDITNQEELPGAELAIIDSEGNVVDQWVSTDQPHVVNLTVGKYTLTERKAPEKYATAESVEFEILEDLSVTKVEMLDAPIQVEISKKDIAGEEELPGAKLTVTDQEGSVVEEWISTTEPHKMSLAVGTYTLTEVAAPEKYAKAESIVFTVSDTAQVQQVTMYDQLIQVEISKKDITNEKELPGAKLTVTDQEGSVVEEWTSTTEPHKLNLPAGTYTLTEVSAPEKYAKAESIQFEVTDSMEVQKVVMYDQPIQVEISKLDITNDEELPGAKLTVKDEEGNLIEEWVSTSEPHKLNLAAGKYTLTEVTAPDGYEVAESIEFEVTDSMEVQHVKMYDSPKDDTIDLTGKTDSKTTGGGGSYTPSSGNPISNVISQAVQTGDFNRYLTAAAIVIAGSVTLLVLFLTRKKKGTGNRQKRKK